MRWRPVFGRTQQVKPGPPYLLIAQGPLASAYGRLANNSAAELVVSPAGDPEIALR